MELRISQDYKQFHHLKGNRGLYPRHITRLATVFAAHPEQAEYSPILVNEKLEILDGQHRFEALKQLKLRWKPEDYAKSFADQGNQNYQVYLDFRERYGFFHGISVAILSQSTDSKPAGRDFRRGQFVVNHPELIDTLAQQQKKPTIPGVNKW